MNTFGSDQMLLPSITQILDPDIKNISSIHQSLLSDDEFTPVTNSCPRPNITRPAPKMLTPPDSPVLSELTTPPYLLRLTSHDGSHMVPNLESVCSGLEMGLHSSFLQPFDSLEPLNHITELETLHARDIMSSTSTRSDDMFDDTDSGSDWPGIYIDDNDDTMVPSPTPSPPFDAPCFYESSDLTTIDSLLVYQEPIKPERRKYNNSISTEESLQSDSGSEGGCCTPLIIPTRPFHSHHTSNKSKSASRTHNYQRRTITKSLTELREEGSKPVNGSPSSPSSSSSSSSGSSIERRKRGRPRKRISGELGDRGMGRRKTTRKAVKGSHLWEFILGILKNEAYCPQYIRWEDKERGVFRIVNSKVVANMWGDIKNNPRMTYEKLSRAMRYYYKREILERVDKARLVYKFGEKAEGWRKVIADE